MKKLGWLAIVSVSVLLGACAQLPTCNSPGVESSNTCYYKLTITKVIDQKAGLVKGTVAQSVVEENRTRWFGYPDFETNEYDPTVFTFHVQDLDTAPQFKGGVEGKTFEFNNVPRSQYLKLKQ